MNKLALAAILLAAPLAARADVGLRLGADVMLSWWLPTSLLSIDAEISEQFLLNPPAGFSSRIGTVFRPGVRVSPPVLPIYVRGAIPINVESPSPYDTIRKTFGLRLGAGITIPLVLFKIYLEADADFPLGGGSSTSSAFSDWDLGLNGGLDFRF